MRQHINRSVRVILGVLICALLVLMAGQSVWTIGQSAPDATLALLTGADPSFNKLDPISCSTKNAPTGEQPADNCPQPQFQGFDCYECTVSLKSDSLGETKYVGQYFHSGSSTCGTLLKGKCNGGSCLNTMNVIDPSTGMPQLCNVVLPTNSKQPTPPPSP